MKMVYMDMVKNELNLELLADKLDNAGRVLVLLDTGAIIDIQAASNKESLTSHNYGGVEQYLRDLGNGKTLMVTPGVLCELKRHSNVKVNGHQREISSAALGMGVMYSERYLEEIAGLDFDNHGSIGLENYLAANNVAKVVSEECKDDPSSVDLEILKSALNFKRIPNFQGELPSEVIILTSDCHVYKGVKELNNLGYGPKVISTRTS